MAPSAAVVSPRRQRAQRVKKLVKISQIPIESDVLDRLQFIEGRTSQHPGSHHRRDEASAVVFFFFPGTCTDDQTKLDLGNFRAPAFVI